MGANPFDVHQASLADYLSWLKLYSPTVGLAVPIFTWQNNYYSCNYSWVEHKDLTPGGFTSMDDLVLEILEPMDGVPQSEQMITFQEKEFRIRSVTLAAGKNPKLVCYDPARGS